MLDMSAYEIRRATASDVPALHSLVCRESEIVATVTLGRDDVKEGL
ncbi:MAG: hypothetical protein DDT20_00146 [Firmicutes bacterium]|nr:hypothetical protein [Bacillota bacterium]